MKNTKEKLKESISSQEKPNSKTNYLFSSNQGNKSYEKKFNSNLKLKESTMKESSEKIDHNLLHSNYGANLKLTESFDAVED